MGPDFRSIGVERHRHGQPGPPHAVQSRVTAVVNVQDVTGRDDSMLNIIGTPTHANREFVAGDYVVVRDGAGFALSWGKVSAVRSDLHRQGERLVHATFGVSTAGWWDFLKRASIYVPVVDSSRDASVGTLFTLPDWVATTAGYLVSSSDLVGGLLQRMFKDLGRIRLPESLGGGFIGDEIPVVYDATTVEMYAPMFAGIEAVDTGTLLPEVITPLMAARSATVGSLLEGVFLPEPMIIELFPALVEGGSAEYSALATALGRRPVLVYRVKPFRMEPLHRAAVAKVSYSFEDVEAATRQIDQDDVREAAQQRALQARLDSQRRSREVLITGRMFTQVSFDPSNPQQVVGIPASLVNRITRQSQDSARVNASTISIVPSGGAHIDSSAAADLPIFDDHQVEQHGLRLHKSRWPFYSVDRKQMIEYYRAVAAQVMQFQANAHLLETGTVVLRYKAATVYEEDQSQGQTTFRPEVDIRPGVWFRVKLEGVEEYFGYVTAVQHKVSKDIDGRKPGETTMNFTRGHYATESAIIMQPTVPVGGSRSARLPRVGRAPDTEGSRVNLTPPPQDSDTSATAGQGSSENQDGAGVLFNATDITRDAPP